MSWNRKMSRPLKDEPIEALERRLGDVRADRSGLTAILHELSFRDGPRETILKDRAEAAWIQLAIALAQPTQGQARGQSHGQSQGQSQGQARPGRDGATRETADAAASRTVHSADDIDNPATPRGMHKDFPGFDPGPMLSEMTTFRSVLTAEDNWRKPHRHFAVLAASVLGVVALVTAHLAGAFQPAQSRAVQAAPEAATAREVSQLPYIPMGVSGNVAAGEAMPTGVALAGAGPQPNRPGVVRPVGRIALTTDLGNIYDGEAPQIARAAVAAAGLGLNETVRWRNEISGRHGTVTLIAQNPQRTSCYTARITRLDTKTPQGRTQQLCF